MARDKNGFEHLTKEKYGPQYKIDMMQACIFTITYNFSLSNRIYFMLNIEPSRHYLSLILIISLLSVVSKTYSISYFQERSILLPLFAPI